MMEKFGFPIKESYSLGLRFLKEKEGKAFHLSYDDKTKLIAYSMLIKNGPFQASKAPETGLLDVVGRDRKAAWQRLGSLTNDEALNDFLCLLDKVCPSFQPFLEAHRKEAEEKERLRKEEEERLNKEKEVELAAASKMRQAQKAEAVLKAEHIRKNHNEIQLRAALNKQTIAQFKQYAEQQYPNDICRQEELIKQLQEQHFQQYIEQVYQQQLLYQTQNNTSQSKLIENWNALPKSDSIQNSGQDNKLLENCNSSKHLENDAAKSENAGNCSAVSPNNNSDISELENGHSLGQSSLAPPNMWVRKDIQEFKSCLVEDKDAILKIGSGEVVTVRVPTHEEGSCLFWEFSTDHYDIGFGVYFEWHPTESDSLPADKGLTIEVDDLNSDARKLSSEITKSVDPTLISNSLNGKTGDSTKEELKSISPVVDEIVPVYRRDSQTEVYCGSHHYPGKGVYLLKFDNSYSLWRAKTLYYRVYYTR